MREDVYECNLHIYKLKKEIYHQNLRRFIKLI